jgi:hypothetical protein
MEQKVQMEPRPLLARRPWMRGSLQRVRVRQFQRALFRESEENEDGWWTRDRQSTTGRHRSAIRRLRNPDSDCPDALWEANASHPPGGQAHAQRWLPCFDRSAFDARRPMSERVVRIIAFAADKTLLSSPFSRASQQPSIPNHLMQASFSTALSSLSSPCFNVRHSFNFVAQNGAKKSPVGSSFRLHVG